MKLETGKEKTSVSAAVLAFLLVSAYLPLQLAYAQTMTINLSQGNGPIGTQVVINGTLENVGAQFKIFWEKIKEWDGGSGLLARGYAEGYNYTATIKVPPASAGGHYIIVEDEKNHATTYAIFTVTPIIAVDPNKGPAGINVTVSGILINNEAITLAFYDPTLGNETFIAEAQTDENGNFTTQFTVPQIPPRDYTVRTYWKGQLQAEAPFKVLPPPSITVNPTEGLPGDEVNVTGAYFAPNEEVTVYFFNEPIIVASAYTDNNGGFTAIFNVPFDAALGTHTIKTVDKVYGQYGLQAEASFTVHSVVIKPRMSAYLQGDTVSFYLNSTLQFEPGTAITIKITDFSGIPFSTFTIDAADLVNIRGVWAAPYDKATLPLIIPSDAQLGTWSWYATFYLTLYPGEEKNADGTFEVLKKPSLNMVLERMAELGTKIEGILQKADDLYLLIQTSKGEVLAKLDEVEARLTSAIITAKGEMLAKIDTAVGQIELRLNELNAKIVEVKDDTVLIKTDLGTVKADLATVKGIVSGLGGDISTIRNSVASIQSDMGTIKAELKALNGKITLVQNGTATIETSIGELTANLTATNASIKNLNGTVATLQTDLGEVKVSINELGARIATVEGLNVTIATCLGSLHGTVESIDSNIANILVPGLGRIEALVSTAEDASIRAESAATGVSTIMYMTVALAAAATLISAANFLQTKRRATS